MVMTLNLHQGGAHKKMAKLRSRLGILMAEHSHKHGEKLTNKALGDIVGLHENTISRLVNQDFKAIEADTIEKLCTFFELDDLDDLLVVVRE